MTLNDALSVAHGALVFGLVFAAAISDMRKGTIPNALPLAGVLLGLWLAYVRGDVGTLWSGQPVGLLSAAAGAAVLFALFFLVYKTGGMGAGDVKLMTAVGALTGLRFGIWTLFNAAVVGMALAIGVLVWRGKLTAGLRSAARLVWKRKAEEELTVGVRIPYGVAVLGGVGWTVWMYWTRGMPLPFF